MNERKKEKLVRLYNHGLLTKYGIYTIRKLHGKQQAVELEEDSLYLFDIHMFVSLDRMLDRRVS